MRSSEAKKTKWLDVDLEQNTIRVNSLEKNINARMFKVSSKLIAMFNASHKNGEYGF